MRKKRAKVKAGAIEQTTKTEKIQMQKRFILTTLSGFVVRFEAGDYAAAQEWSKKQLDAMGLVFPKDVTDLKEIE